MQPLTRKHKTAPLTNWYSEYDAYGECWWVCHYVGGEDGVTAISDHATKEEADKAVAVANAAGHTHTHHIDL